MPSIGLDMASEHAEQVAGTGKQVRESGAEGQLGRQLMTEVLV